MKKIEIFDTTLRDGEQAPGASLPAASKLQFAHALADLGVDVIEAGFPAASGGEAAAVRSIATEVRGTTIAALARARDGDIDAAARALAPAERKRIHVFIATSEIHLEQKLRIDPLECIERAGRAVRRATEHADEVEFSAEDATRTDIHFLVTVYQEAARAGARIINVPDTVGYAQPYEFAKLVLAVRGSLATYNGGLRVSVHCHNDLGLAVANTLAAIGAGAQQAHVCINGIGERGGNASLEEIAMALSVRRDLYEATTGIRTERIVPTSRLYSELTGIPVQPNKAIVGANAFAHESGIHQDGVLKHRETYEIMRAEDVGWNANKLTLGKLSGRNALRQRFTALNIEFASDEAFNAAFQRFKELADRKHEIFDEDLQALVSDEAVAQVSEHYRLAFMRAHSETGILPVAKVAISIDGEQHEAEAQGGGPVDATFQAIEKIVHSGTELQLYSVNNITSGTDAQGEVTVRLAKGGRIVNGQGADTDIVVASAKAYLNALNKLHSKLERAHPQL